MINWPEMSELHVVSKLESILQRWFNLELFFADMNGKIVSKQFQKGYVTNSPIFKSILDAAHGYDSFMQDIDKILELGKKSKDTLLNIYSNFNHEKIKNMFSNLSSISLTELIKLKKNYDALNYSSTDVNVQIHKLFSYPIFLTIMTILSSIMMFNSKTLKSNTLKLVFGLFVSVIIYYTNNFFYVLGNTEKLSVLSSVWSPLLILSIISTFFLRNINEK